MIKILAIGNSFSQDATAYLHDIGVCGGIANLIGNLCIGGCSLLTHWENIENDLCNYGYEINGSATGKKVTVSEILKEDEWDIVTIQQASHDSGLPETYMPYALRISEYIKQHLPNSRLVVHQTWAYEHDSTHDGFARYNNDQSVMYNALKNAYEKTARELGAEMIPSGDVLQKLRTLEPFGYSRGGRSLCCDGFHMERVYGRYAVAATWFERILGGDITQNDFIPPSDEPIDDNLIGLIKTVVHELCK